MTWFMFALMLSAACPVWAQPECTVEGPDSVFFDKTLYNTYLPASFEIRVMVINPGPAMLDSLVVFARSNQRFTIVAPATKLLADSMRPGDTLRTEFTLIVNPRDVSGMDTVAVAVSAKAGVRGSCLLPIWVEKEYKPLNEIICPPDSNYLLAFIDSLNAYVPDPFAVPVTVINHGDAPSKETRIMYVATPGIAPADGQEPILDVGTIAAGGGRVDRVFQLRPVRRTNDTTMTMQFRVQGKGGLGDRIIDTICATTVHVPPARDAAFSLQCRNGISIRFDSGRYDPDPFSWWVMVRNTGNATARNVRAFITLPPSCQLDTNEQAEIALGAMRAGDERSVTWRIRVKARERADTALICVHVLDDFNRTADCCDTIIVPEVRRARLTARCDVVPDSIRVNPVTGQYQPAACEVRVSIQNDGTEHADSLVAELSVSDPDITFLAPPDRIQFVSARLDPRDFTTVSWQLAPMPSLVNRAVTVTARVRCLGQPEIVTACVFHVDAALMPALQCETATTPDDTLHYDPVSLVHDPLSITARVRNAGTIGARNVQATVLLPSYLFLANGEFPSKICPVSPLPPDSEWTVTWRLLPVRQQTGVLDSIGVEFRGDGVRTMCGDWIFVVGIPPRTVLRIPVNFVERYGGRLRVPVIIDNTDKKNIRELDVVIRYDSTKVRFLGFDRTGTMLDTGWIFQPFASPGMIRFTGISPGGYLQGEGTLVNMDFLVTFGWGADQLRVSGTALDFDSVASSVNQGSVQVRYYDGYIWTSGDCLIPLTATDKYLVVSAKPNPFNPSTLIRYTLPGDGPVRLRVFDLFGRDVALLADGFQQKGIYEVSFNGESLASGLYLAVLEAAGIVRTLHLRLIK